MDAEKAGAIRKNIVEVGGESENASLGVRDLRNGAESDEQRNLILEVILVL